MLNVDLLGAFYFIKQAFLHMKPGGSDRERVQHSRRRDRGRWWRPTPRPRPPLLSLTRSAAIEGKP
ncbi:MAG: hypothetical protein WKG07_49615 [Hymenobacter sp.]